MKTTPNKTQKFFSGYVPAYSPGLFCTASWTRLWVACSDNPSVINPPHLNLYSFYWVPVLAPMRPSLLHLSEDVLISLMLIPHFVTIWLQCFTGHSRFGGGGCHDSLRNEQDAVAFVKSSLLSSLSSASESIVRDTRWRFIRSFILRTCMYRRCSVGLLLSQRGTELYTYFLFTQHQY